MFTGIITDIGHVRRIVPGPDTRIEIATAYAVESIDLGASIACSGACMTVIETGTEKDGSGGSQSWFAVEASPETLARTTLGGWREGERVNLERALRLGDELGGHIVSGHVDGLASVLAREAVAGDPWGSTRFLFAPPEGFSRFVAPKGSVALDGVSLTVNTVTETGFTVNVIPHTLSQTTLGALEEGSTVNFEADTIARYVARLSGLL